MNRPRRFRGSLSPVGGGDQRRSGSGGASVTCRGFRLFLIRVLQLAGVLSLAAGLVFFIAASWQAIGVTGRFALIRLSSSPVSRSPCGNRRRTPRPCAADGLCRNLVRCRALFGQTYQTGADVAELFLTREALLGLAFVVAGQWSVLGAAWLLVFSVQRRVAAVLQRATRRQVAVGGVLAVSWRRILATARASGAQPGAAGAWSSAGGVRWSAFAAR